MKEDWYYTSMFPSLNVQVPSVCQGDLVGGSCVPGQDTRSTQNFVSINQMLSQNDGFIDLLETPGFLPDFYNVRRPNVWFSGGNTTARTLHYIPTSSGPADFLDATLQFTMLISGDLINVQQNVVTDANIANFTECVGQINGHTGTIGVTVKNSGTIAGDFSVAINCSGGITALQSPKSISLDAQASGTVSFALQFPGLTPQDNR